MDAATTEFARQLRGFGYEPTELGPNRITYKYTVETGRFAGQEVIVGLDVPPDFDRTPPSGPHISPRILPLNPSAPAHPERVAESNFGPEFEYWSRPYPSWGKDGRDKRDVGAYLAFLRHLFATS
jgi:hypothetical protein